MTALVVDDDAINRELLRRMMSLHEWSVKDVHSGCRAIEECATFLYDLVLVDFFMPGMNGCETARAIRNAYAVQTHDVVIIIVTGSDCLDAEDSSIFDGILVKPFTSDELMVGVSLAFKNHV